MLKATLLDVSLLKENQDNPRTITDAKLTQLTTSVKKFPQMLEARPIAFKMALDGTRVVLGGNMRLRACIAAGLTKVPAIDLSGLTDEQQREFIIRDNVSFGEWSWDVIQAEWPEAEEWGLDIPDFTDYSDKNKEINIDELDSEMVIKLKYTEDDYHLVKGQLMKISANPEQAVWKLLGNE